MIVVRWGEGIQRSSNQRSRAKNDPVTETQAIALFDDYETKFGQSRRLLQGSYQPYQKTSSVIEYYCLEHRSRELNSRN